MPHERQKPDLTYSVNMTPKEAVARKIVAKKVEGVTFVQADSVMLGTGDTLRALPGHVIGTTSAESVEALKEFNIKLRKLIIIFPSR